MNFSISDVPSVLKISGGLLSGPTDLPHSSSNIAFTNFTVQDEEDGFLSPQYLKVQLMRGHLETVQCALTNIC